MNKNYFFTALIALLFSNITFAQVVADYDVLIIQGNTTTHLEVIPVIEDMGHTLTPVPYADVTDGFDFSAFDVAILMWDTPMTFSGYDDLIEANEACELGIISMSHYTGMDSLFLGQGNSWTDQTFGISDNTHWITEPFAVGALPLDFTYKTKLTNIPDNVTTLGLTGVDTCLVVHDEFKRASGIYYGHTSGMPWNGDAETLIDRIICWAAASCCDIDTDVNNADYVLTALEDDATYQWIDCADDSEIVGATDQTLSPTENGEYAVIITTDECTDTSDCKIVAGLSVNAYGELIKVSIHPNPSNGNFNIQTNATEAAKVLIYDTSGKVVLESKMQGELYIDLALESGTYFVQYIASNATSVSKIIVQ
jgi:hypothetical protein